MPIASASWRGRVAACWGILGVTIFLGAAIHRLSLHVLASLQQPWTRYQWIVLGAVLVFMLYSEGYRGFQKGFSPRVAARARYLLTTRSWLLMLAAPLFCMSYFGAKRRRMIVAYTFSAMIVLLVTLFQHIPQPWRGLLDVGVMAGLLWGLVSFWLFSYRALTQTEFAYSAQLPEASDYDEQGKWVVES